MGNLNFSLNRIVLQFYIDILLGCNSDPFILDLSKFVLNNSNCPALQMSYNITVTSM